MLFINTVLGGINATKYLYNQAIKGLLNAPISFFDSNPIGRIINRMGSDLNELDFSIPSIIFNLTFEVTMLIGCVIIICQSNYFLISNFNHKLTYFSFIFDVYNSMLLLVFVFPTNKYRIKKIKSNL